jgi:hypothetical protein
MSDKNVKYDLISEKDNAQPYRLLADVRQKYHSDTQQARVVLAWVNDVKSDADGRIMLGKCVPVSLLQKELIDYDFIILLNKDVWGDGLFDVAKKRALLDHEMSHIAPVLNSDGEATDGRGRRLWRTRGHEIEEFSGVVERHGTYKADLERFAEALLKARGTPLFPIDEVPVSRVQ